MGMRIGHGYDVHRLAKGRRLILGGTVIPYEKGLLGHSDADVLAHAAADALLGAAALGDIGALFPDSDPQYRGADSLWLLSQVADRVRQAGYAVSNLDATVLAQAPRSLLYPTDAGASGGGLRCRARAGQRQGDDRGGPRLHRHARGHRRARGLPAGTAAFGRRF